MDLDELEKEVERESAIRRRVLRVFNKTEEDFETEEEYNDYLEMVEELIDNLVHGRDVSETNARIAAYRERHAASIRRNERRLQEREREAAARLAEEERERRARLQALTEADNEEVARRRREEERERTRHWRALVNEEAEGADVDAAGSEDATASETGRRRRAQGGTSIRVRGAQSHRLSVAVQDTGALRLVAPSKSVPRAPTATVQRFADERTRRAAARQAAGYHPDAWRQRALSELCIWE